MAEIPGLGDLGDAGDSLSSILGALFGSDKTTDVDQTAKQEAFLNQLVTMFQTSSSTQRGEQATNLDAILNQLVTQDQATTGSSSTTNLGEEDQLALRELIQQVTGRLATAGEGFSTEDAKSASASARNAAIQQALEFGIGDIISAGSNVGAFDSTVQATGAERLGSRAVTEGAAAELATIKDFKQLADDDRNALLQSVTDLFSQLSGATSTTVQDSSTTGITGTESKSSEVGSTESSTETDTVSSSTQQTEQESKSETETSTKTKEDEKGFFDFLGF